jgi:hypothetical protein
VVTKDPATPSDASLLAPTVDGTVYRWRFGEASFTVDAGLGARITEFCVGAENILTSADVNPINFGSTCWTSPQSQWGWPPPPELDREPYEVVGTPPELEFRSRPAAALGMVIAKRFRVDPERETFSVAYTFENLSQTPRTLAPWEISRHPVGGLTFFPKGDGVEGRSTLRSLDAEGAVWFDYDAGAITAHQKLFAHGAEGWAAHLDIARGMLLIKTFPAIAAAEQAPGEAQLEVYADPEHTYVELEQQGPYRTLEPGEKMDWTVVWRLRRLPAAIAAKAGNRDLLALVRAMI